MPVPLRILLGAEEAFLVQAQQRLRQEAAEASSALVQLQDRAEQLAVVRLAAVQ